jgi:hypothetical protein
MRTATKRGIGSRNHPLRCPIVGEPSKSISAQSCYCFVESWKYHFVEDTRRIADKIHFAAAIDLVDQSPILLQHLDNFEPVISAYNLYVFTHGYCDGSLDTGYPFRNIVLWRLRQAFTHYGRKSVLICP